MTKEIERKYIISEIGSNFIQTTESLIHQNYISSNDNDELRIRFELDDNEKIFSLTYKAGNGLVRVENEMKISSLMFFDLLNKTKEKPLSKTRKYGQINNIDVSVDLYGEEFNRMMIVEIEFATLDEANAFIPPSWFTEEVTENSRFKNKNLWREIQEHQRPYPEQE